MPIELYAYLFLGAAAGGLINGLAGDQGFRRGRHYNFQTA